MHNFHCSNICSSRLHWSVLQNQQSLKCGTIFILASFSFRFAKWNLQFALVFFLVFDFKNIFVTQMKAICALNGFYMYTPYKTSTTKKKYRNNYNRTLVCRLNRKPRIWYRLNNELLTLETNHKLKIDTFVGVFFFIVFAPVFILF